MTLFWKVFVSNAALVSVAAVALLLTPATVSEPVLMTEALVLMAGVGVVVLANWLILRRAFQPLEELKALMAHVDPLRPGARMPEDPDHREFEEVARAFNEMLARLEEERRESARRASAAQEDERRRVARDLHDEVGQRLGALLLEAQGLATRAPKDFVTPVEELREGVRGTLAEVREIARRLRPEALDELGLPSALAALTATFVRSGLDVQRTIERPLPALDPDEELVIYRVAQEALANVARHAGCHRAELRLERRQGLLTLIVRDDGIGFDGGADAHGQGLRSMRERAITIGASLRVDTVPGAGTAVELTLPPRATS